MHGIYRQVQKKLKEGYKVLFTGTPCQVNALKLFLKEDYDNLILVDLFVMEFRQRLHGRNMLNISQEAD